MSTICLPRLNQACPNPKAAKSLGSGPSPAGRQSGITVRRLGGLVGHRQPSLASHAELHTTSARGHLPALRRLDDQRASLASWYGATSLAMASADATKPALAASRIAISCNRAGVRVSMISGPSLVNTRGRA